MSRGTAVDVRPVDAVERRWLGENRAELFGGGVIVSRGRVHRPLELPGFVANVGGSTVGAALYEIREGECELVSLDALRRWQGIGTALLAAVETAARARRCGRVWLITTNDNTDAMRFYQRRGYRFVAIHRGAIDESRRLKPTIPPTGRFGIPLLDEIEMEKALAESG